MANRAGQSRQRLSAQDLAGSVWDSLEASEKQTLHEFLETLPGERFSVTILEGKARAFGESHFFESSSVEYATQKQKVHVEYENPQQAELVTLLSDLGIHGTVQLPKSAKICKQWITEIKELLKKVQQKFESLEKLLDFFNIRFFWNGIHITYEDGALLAERLNNIINNTFSGNTDDIWCDELD